MAQRTALHLLWLWLRLRRWLRCRLSGTRIRSGARCRARLVEMEPANCNVLGKLMKSANKNVMSKDLKLGNVETLHYPLACLGDIDLNGKMMPVFRHKKESTMLLKEKKHGQRMISHGHGPSKHRPMNASK